MYDYFCKINPFWLYCYFFKLILKKMSIETIFFLDYIFLLNLFYVVQFCWLVRIDPFN